MVEYRTTGGLSAYMNYYPPANKDVHKLPDGHKPPLLVGRSAMQCLERQCDGVR